MVGNENYCFSLLKCKKSASCSSVLTPTTLLHAVVLWGKLDSPIPPCWYPSWIPVPFHHMQLIALSWMWLQGEEYSDDIWWHHRRAVQQPLPRAPAEQWRLSPLLLNSEAEWLVHPLKAFQPLYTIVRIAWTSPAKDDQTDGLVSKDFKAGKES